MHICPIYISLLTLSFLCSFSLAEAEGMSKDKVIQIYKNVDVPVVHCLPCLEDDYSVFMCPEFEEIVCSCDEEVRDWCQYHLWLEDAEFSEFKLDGTNVLNGYMVYIGWGEDQKGCCNDEWQLIMFCKFENYSIALGYTLLR